MRMENPTLRTIHTHIYIYIHICIVTNSITPMENEPMWDSKYVYRVAYGFIQPKT